MVKVFGNIQNHYTDQIQKLPEWETMEWFILNDEFWKWWITWSLWYACSLEFLEYVKIKFGW